MEDKLFILAPVFQCCLLRFSTFEKIYMFYKGPKPLSDLMRESMSEDPVSPILLDSHLVALNRRVKLILKTVYNCIDKIGLLKVLPEY